MKPLDKFIAVWLSAANGCGDEMRKLFIIWMACAGLTSCQTSYTYEPIIPNPENLEIANAKCNMASSSAEQGIVVYGSPMYVATQQAANSLGNMDRVDRFMLNCMTTQGWRRVAAQPAKTAPPSQTPPMTAEQKEIAMNALASQRIASTCGIKLNAKTAKDLHEFGQLVGPSVRAEADSYGRQGLDRKIKELGRPEACRQFSEILKKGGMV